MLSHAQALLTSTPEGRTDYIQADLRNTGTISQWGLSGQIDPATGGLVGYCAIARKP